MAPGPALGDGLLHSASSTAFSTPGSLPFLALLTPLLLVLAVFVCIPTLKPCSLSSRAQATVSEGEVEAMTTLLKWTCQVLGAWSRAGGSVANDSLSSLGELVHAIPIWF